MACGFSDLSHRANLVFKTKNRTGQGKARRGRDSRRNTFDPTSGARVGEEGRGLTSVLHGAGKGIQDYQYVGTKTKTTAYGRVLQLLLAFLSCDCFHFVSELSQRRGKRGSRRAQFAQDVFGWHSWSPGTASAGLHRPWQGPGGTARCSCGSTNFLDKPTCRTRCQTLSTTQKDARTGGCVHTWLRASPSPATGCTETAQRARARLRARIKVAQERQDRELSETLAGANENAREQRRDNQDSFGECGGSQSLGGQRTKRSQTCTKVSPQ